MTIGGIVGILALAGAFGAAAVRRRDAFWAGVMYFGLPPSNDPHSVLYSEILSVADLDRLGEDF